MAVQDTVKKSYDYTQYLNLLQTTNITVYLSTRENIKEIEQTFKLLHFKNNVKTNTFLKTIKY